MRLLTAEAQVLSVRDLQEADRIVAVLTADHGKVRGVARGAKRKFSRFAGPLHPLAKVQASWSAKPSSELVRFSALDLVRPAEAMQSELEAILYSAYLADQAETFAQEQEAAPELYRLVDRVVGSLLSGSDREAVVRYFEVWLLRLAGVLGEPGACQECGNRLTDGSAIGSDGFLCHGCAGGGAISRESLGFVAISRQQAPEQIAGLGWPPEVLAEVEGICATIRRRFLGVELRSYTILQQVLREGL